MLRKVVLWGSISKFSSGKEPESYFHLSYCRINRLKGKDFKNASIVDNRCWSESNIYHYCPSWNITVFLLFILSIHLCFQSVSFELFIEDAKGRSIIVCEFRIYVEVSLLYIWERKCQTLLEFGQIKVGENIIQLR